MNNINWVYNVINRCVNNNFTGSISINFFEGGISNINQNQSLKPQPEKLEGSHELLSKKFQK